MYVITRKSETKPLAYYAEGGFPWWAYDAATHATKYDNREIAEKHAKQLQHQNTRGGSIAIQPYK